jgi:hypothetical protein
VPSIYREELIVTDRQPRQSNVLFTEQQKAEARRIGELVELDGFLHRVYKTRTGQIVAIPVVWL